MMAIAPLMAAKRTELGVLDWKILLIGLATRANEAVSYWLPASPTISQVWRIHLLSGRGRGRCAQSSNHN